LQLFGKKSWKVYGPSRLHPLSKDVEENATPPQEVLWEGMLEDGDLLYIPRGWWHVATPVNEPTLHLTIGFSNPTGVDLLAWLTDQLRKAEIVRKDLPRFASPDDQQEHMRSIRDALLAAWDASLLQRFFDATAAMTPGRARLSLPWSATPELLPPDDSALVQLTVPRNLRLVEDASHGVVEFSCMGKRWRFILSSLPILRALQNGEVHSIAALCHLPELSLSPTDVRALLGELLTVGLVAIVPDRLGD